MNEKKSLPLGVEDFRKLRCNNYFSIDKTLLIKEIIECQREVTLFARPRRFGKSLNLSMLKYFFDINGSGKELFSDTALARSGYNYADAQGKYPVIFISLKELKKLNYEAAEKMFRFTIGEIFSDNFFLLDSPKVNSYRKQQFRQLLEPDANIDMLATSLRLVTQMLQEHYGQPTVVLIDEYDVPLQAGYLYGYYDKILDLIRSFLSSTCKTNPNLHMAVLTGCLRIAGESIFTGFNNPEINTILSANCGEYFGFTENEVRELLDYYGIPEAMAKAKEWYDCYMFCGTKIFNPWSIIQFVTDTLSLGVPRPRSYWGNTSDNALLRNLISNSVNGSSSRNDIERLLEGEAVCHTVNENLNYNNLADSKDSIWSVMLQTGYLKPTKEPAELENFKDLPMLLPNKEIREVLLDNLDYWYKESFLSWDSNSLVAALEAGDPDSVEAELNDFLMRTVSFHDRAENFYHGFVTGLLAAVKDHACLSNRESGNGRSDIQFHRPDRKAAVIIELKAADSEITLHKDAEDGLKQTQIKKYADHYRALKFQSIHVYGIACFEKMCKVVM